MSLCVCVCMCVRACVRVCVCSLVLKITTHIQLKCITLLSVLWCHMNSTNPSPIFYLTSKQQPDPMWVGGVSVSTSRACWQTATVVTVNDYDHVSAVNNCDALALTWPAHTAHTYAKPLCVPGKHTRTHLTWSQLLYTQAFVAGANNKKEKCPGTRQTDQVASRSWPCSMENTQIKKGHLEEMCLHRASNKCLLILVASIRTPHSNK